MRTSHAGDIFVAEGVIDQPRYHKDLLPVSYVVGDMAGNDSNHVDSPLYGMFAMRGDILATPKPSGGKLGEYFISQPQDPYRQYAVKSDGEWQVTYETFRDMGAAYAVGLILIYLLVVAQFGAYLTPLVIMAPIPRTIIVMPGHALLGAQYTATSMIGMIALVGIIVRNSILLVDFINLQLAEGVSFREAVVHSAATRTQPIILTGLAISLIFGILVSTLLTLVVIPLLYYVAYRRKLEKPDEPQTPVTQHNWRNDPDILANRACHRRHLHPPLTRPWRSGQSDIPQRELALVPPFVGANLLQSGITKWCLMDSILRKLGLGQAPEPAAPQPQSTESIMRSTALALASISLVPMRPTRLRH